MEHRRKMKSHAGGTKQTQRKQKNGQAKRAVYISAFFLCTVLLPLLIISHFNYPSSDDFSFAGSIYNGVTDGSGFWTIVRDAWETAKSYYRNWQGCYFSNIVSCFGWGIAIPKYYFSGTYFVLGTFIAASISFMRTVTFRLCQWDSESSWLCSLLVTAMQVLYVPHPSEAFYWYLGATAYTFSYALLLFLGEALLHFYLAETGKGRILSGISAVILTAMAGGTNYATGLLAAELLVLSCILMLAQKKRCGFLLAITAEYIIGFCFNAFSPGNATRMGAVESLGVFGSIFASLQRGGIFLREWFHLPVALILLAVFILCAYPVAKMKYSFRLPGLVTIITYGLFCSLMTPPFFAGATWGPGRLINLVYFSYYFLLIGNLLYWTGWAAHKYKRFWDFLTGENRLGKMRNHAEIVVICFLLLLVVCLKIYGLQSTSSSSAFLSLVKGEAAQYKAENEYRWEIYTDSSVMDAEVEDFSVKPYVLYHDDIATDASDWRNVTVAGFFGKNSVRLKG